MSVGQPNASTQYASWKEFPKTYGRPTDEDWLAEIAALKARIKELEASKLVFVPELSDDMKETYLDDNIRLQAMVRELENNLNCRPQVEGK